MSANANKRIAKNTLFLYIRMLVVLVVTLFTTRIVLKNLGAEDYGIYNVVCGFVAMFSFINTTLSGSINRFYNFEIGRGSSEGITRVYNTSLLIQAGIAFLLVLIIEIVGVWYINSKMVIPIERLQIANWVFQISVISLVFVIMQAPYSAAVMAHEKMNFYAFVSVLDAVLKLIIALAIKNSPIDKLLIYASLIGLLAIINFALYFIYAKRNFAQLYFERRYDKHSFKKMVSFSGWNMLETIAYTIRGQGSNMLLNLFFGPLVNTAHGVSNQAAVGLDSFSSSISLAFRPQIIQSYSSGNKERMNSLVFSMSKIMFLLNLMIFIPAAFEMNYILDVWLNDVPKYAVEFTCLILMVKLVNTFNPPLTNAVMANGKTKYYMISVAIIVSSILPISYVLFRNGAGPVALFVVMLLLTIINQAVAVIIVSKLIDEFKVKEYVKCVVKPCFLHGMILSLSLAIVYYLFPDNIYRLLVEVILSVIITVVSGYFVLLNKAEKDICGSAINKFIKFKNR